MSLEGENTYPDAILRQQDREKREERHYLDSSLVEMGESAAIGVETEEGIKALGESMEREKKVQEMLSKFEQLSERKSLKGFDVFKVFIEQANGEIQKNFLNKVGSRNIRNNIMKSGRFPVNEFEFQQSLIEGTILENISKTEGEVAETEGEVAETEGEVAETEDEVAETEDEVAETEDEVAETEKNIRERGGKIAELHQDINISQYYRGDFSEYERLMNQEGSWSKSERETIKDIQKAIIGVLGQGTILEQTILPQALAQGPEVFERVSRNLVGLDKSFQVRIDAWRLTPDYGKLPAEQMMRVSGALGVRADEVENQAEQSGNIFSLDLPGGAVVEYDVMRDSRTLSVDGYRLSSQVPDVGDYQTPKLAYMRIEQAHLPQLQKIVSAGEALNQAGIESDNISQIQDILKNTLGYSYFVELGINTLDNAEAIQTKLSEAYREHHEPINQARSEYRDTLINLRNNYARALEKRDKKTREVLDFFRSIGFTMIPQSLTDQIFDTLNKSPSLAAKYGFNKLPIDFANGSLGIDLVSGDSETLEMPSKTAFAEFINAILGSDIINIENIRSGAGEPITNRASLRGVIAQSGILNVGGIGRAWKNIDKHYGKNKNSTKK